MPAWFSSVSPAWSTDNDPEQIVALARVVFADAERKYEGAGLPTVRVQTKRADKRFPMRSTELDVHIAEQIFDDERHVVRLKGADITLGDGRPAV